MARAACSHRSRIAARIASYVLWILMLLTAGGAVAGGINLAWDPVSNTSLAGYMLYYGPSVGSYTNKIDVGNRTSYSVSNLTDGATYHFVVTAYDASRAESAYSNDVVATVAVISGLAANFTASTTSGAAPLAMNFTNTSTGSITSYAWNFGDGTSSASQSPAHVYSAPGVYTVSLTVTGSAGSSTKTIPNYVTVTSAGDTIAPGAPGTLNAAVSGTSVNLTWQPATDNVGVAGYRVERCDGST
jgi:PKD repeat protein